MSGGSSPPLSEIPTGNDGISEEVGSGVGDGEGVGVNEEVGSGVSDGEGVGSRVGGEDVGVNVGVVVAGRIVMIYSGLLRRTITVKFRTINVTSYIPGFTYT